MKKKLLIGSLLFPLILSATCKNIANYEITTGSKTGTYYQIGLNLAKYVAPDACINLKALNSKGSLDNAYKLRSPSYKRLKFAIVQNDVLQELQRFSKEGVYKAKDLVDNLRVLAPLYDEEIHILTKKNSSIKTFADLRNKTLSIGSEKSGTAMTSHLLYKELFGENLTNFKLESFDNALNSLGEDKVDAVIKVVGQPYARMSKEMGKNASDFIKLISYDEKDNAQNPITSYYTSEIYDKNYPWISEDIPTLSTKAYLVTFNYQNPTTVSYLKNFMISFNNKLKTLQNTASKDNNTPHVKWKQIDSVCGSKLPGGWKFHSVVSDICNNPTNSRITGSNKNECTAYKRSVGLCN
jgi:TRAP transporter TAXI family solute receptor